MVNISITTHSKAINFYLSNKIKLLSILLVSSLLALIIYCISIAWYWKQQADTLLIFKNNLVAEKNSLVDLNATLVSQLSMGSDMDFAEDNFIPFNNLHQDISNPALDTIFSSHVGEIEQERILQHIPNGYPSYTKYITSGYGWRSHPLRGRYHFHKGIDFGTVMKSEVKATAHGVVEYAGYDQNGFGNFVKIRHSFGFTTYYAHLKSMSVHKGSFVKKGSVIGYSGNSGASTGPHLHYAIKYLDKYVNPKSFLSWDTSNYENVFAAVENVNWQDLFSLLDSNKQSINYVSLDEAM